MEFNGQTGFEYMTDGTTKTFSFGLSNKIDESIAAFIDRINPQAAFTIAACTGCVLLGIDPKARKQLMNACGSFCQLQLRRGDPSGLILRKLTRIISLRKYNPRIESRLDDCLFIMASLCKCILTAFIHLMTTIAVGRKTSNSIRVSFAPNIVICGWAFS